jgi:hypothetical protein
MASETDIRLLASPRIFLVGMTSFLILVGFVVLILYKSIAVAFSANPGLNGLIILTRSARGSTRAANSIAISSVFWCF